MLMRFKESPEPPQSGTVPPGHEDKVMHASFRIGDSPVMASDGRCQGQSSFQGFALSLRVTMKRKPSGFCCSGRGRKGADAADEDLLFPEFRDGRRPFRRVVDVLVAE